MNINIHLHAVDVGQKLGLVVLDQGYWIVSFRLIYLPVQTCTCMTVQILHIWYKTLVNRKDPDLGSLKVRSGCLQLGYFQHSVPTAV